MCRGLHAITDLQSLPPRGPSPAATGTGALTRRSSIMDNASEASNYSSPEGNTPTQAARRPPRADRPCDTCRKRKSRCVKEPGQDKCVLCTFHRRDCTYLDEPQRRKKRRTEGTPNLFAISEQDAAAAESYV